MAACPFLLAIWCFAPAEVPPASANDPQAVIASIFNELGVKDFRFRKTKHFIIGYDTSDEFIRPHVGRLEGIHGAVSRFCEANGFTSGARGSGARGRDARGSGAVGSGVQGSGAVGSGAQGSEARGSGAQGSEARGSPFLAKEGARGRSAETPDLLPIIFFDKFETFARYAQKMEIPAEGIAGFYHQSNNVAAFVNAADMPSIRAVNDQLQSMHKRLSEARAAAKNAEGRAATNAIENTIYSVSSQRDSIVEAFNRFVLQHEAAHQILFNAGVHPRGAASPQWLVEGLACQFEVPQPDPSGRRLQVNQMRLADLRELMGNPDTAAARDAKTVPPRTGDLRGDKTVPPPRGDHRGVEREEDVNANEQATARGGKNDAEAVRTSKLIPLKQLVAGDGVFSADRLQAAYAQSWGLVLYLHRTAPDAFREYLHKLAQREVGTQPAPEADLAEFESAFGPLDAKFEQSFADFIARLSL